MNSGSNTQQVRPRSNSRQENRRSAAVAANDSTNDITRQLNSLNEVKH